MLLCLSKLRELIPTSLLDTLTTIADKRANKTTEQHHAIVRSKLTRLQHAAHTPVVVAEIVMQNIEEQALATYSETLPLWLRYVDDTITAVHESKIDEFHEHLNEQDTNIQFTKEIENGKIPFLDCLVTRENNTLRTTVYRKPTHTDRLLDQTSCNPTSHKATTVRTLTRRAQIVCDSDDSLTDEIKHLNTVFIMNNYNTDFIERNT